MEKECFCCGQTKPISDFYRHPGMADGHLGKCKECQKSATKTARAKNPGHYKEYDRRRAGLPHRVQARAEYAASAKGKEAHARSAAKWVAANPNRRAANTILNNAIRDGRVERLPCFVCGYSVTHGHHPDYDRPLDVIWLCAKHHREVHSMIGDSHEQIDFQTGP